MSIISRIEEAFPGWVLRGAPGFRVAELGEETLGKSVFGVELFLYGERREPSVPERCCICGVRKSLKSVVVGRSLFRAGHTLRVCEAGHEKKRGVVVESREVNRQLEHWLCFSLSREFLEEIVALNGRSPPLPWQVFPGSTPLSWKQGYNQVWFERVWFPYWRELAPELRRKQLEFSARPEEWRGWASDDFWGGA